MSFRGVGQRIFVALSDEKILVFEGDRSTAVVTGASRESVKCLLKIDDQTVWCSVANRIGVIDIQRLSVKNRFNVEPRVEQSVQHLTLSERGVWASTRFSGVLKLFDRENFALLVRLDLRSSISALAFVSDRLWIGTTDGSIITIPSDNVDLANAQFSLHGFRTGVKCFLPIGTDRLMCAGNGYVDHRLPKGEVERDFSAHLIIWTI